MLQVLGMDHEEEQIEVMLSQKPHDMDEGQNRSSTSILQRALITKI